MVSAFQSDQIEHLVQAGWATCRSVSVAVEAAGLPSVTADYLMTAFSAREWRKAEDATSALRDHFGGARFANDVTYGVLLVPDPERLDTRRALAPAVRRDQL